MKSGRCPKCQSTDVRVGPPKIGVRQVKVLGPGDERVLLRVAPGVFDHPVDFQLAPEFLRDDHHHLAVALDQGVVVGFASGVTYLHPDKPLELWINEVGVAASHRSQGVGTQVVRALLEVGRAAGCREAWVLTERTNAAAVRLYASAGGTKRPDESVMYSFVLDP
jgi:ribosomal protein S18 acetylase RimI-like enzyme